MRSKPFSITETLIRTICVAALVAVGLCGCSGPAKPVEKKAPAVEKRAEPAKPAPEPEAQVEYDMTKLKKIEIQNVPAAIIEFIDDEYKSINGVSIGDEPVDNAFGSLIDLNNDGTKEWIVSYAGPDDTINAIFQAFDDEWFDIGAAYGAIMKCGPESSTGFLDIHAEAYNGSGEGEGCDGMCDRVVYSWSDGEYREKP